MKEVGVEEQTKTGDSDANEGDEDMLSPAAGEGPEEHSDGSGSDSSHDTETDESDDHSPDARGVRSACPSPTDSLVEHTAALGLRTPPHTKVLQTVVSGTPEAGPSSMATEIVSSELARERARQKKGRHRGKQKVGRQRGSKAKQDLRVKSHDVWE
jgi:RIO kinase 2